MTDGEENGSRQGRLRRWFTRRRVFATLGLLVSAVVALVFGFLLYISTYPKIPPYRPIERVVYLDEEKNACVDADGNPALSGIPAAGFNGTTRNPSSSYQGWCEDYRQNYYRRPQGTTFFGLRYDWVANLERPVGKRPLASREYMQSIGFIYDGAALPNENNPYDLPIGLTWHRDPETGDRILDVSCAACHSSQFTY